MRPKMRPTLYGEPIPWNARQYQEVKWSHGKSTGNCHSIGRCSKNTLPRTSVYSGHVTSCDKCIVMRSTISIKPVKSIFGSGLIRLDRFTGCGRVGFGAQYVCHISFPYVQFDSQARSVGDFGISAWKVAMVVRTEEIIPVVTRGLSEPETETP